MTQSKPRDLTRREAIAASLGGSAAIAGATAATAGGSVASVSNKRQPVAFIPHGGGPWPFVELSFSDPRETAALLDYLRNLSATTPERPRALLVISAHWEEAVPTVLTAAHPPLLYDYYGFPAVAYQVTWSAPGQPTLAARVQELLAAAGIASAANAERGFDHGTFVPLKVAYPAADIPTVQLSLKRGLDPAEHLAIGRALAPLRDEGVFIIGSGMSYHNMRGFGGSGAASSETFDAWLREATLAPAAQRAEQLSAWATAPAARAVHPREEHLLPLMVVVGAAGEDVGELAYNDTYGKVRLSAFHFS